MTETEADRRDLTIDDLEDLPEGHRYELIDGRLVLMSEVFPIYSMTRVDVGQAVNKHCPPQLFVTIGQALSIDRHNQLRTDVAVLRGEMMFSSVVLPSDVSLVVQVRSKPTTASEWNGRLKKYLGARIPSCWIFDVLGEHVTFTEFVHTEDGRYDRRHYVDELVTVDVPWRVTLDLPAWTRQIQRGRAAARRRG